MSKEIRDEIICYCNNINYSKISSILETNPNIDFEKFQNISSAGTSCSACLPKLENIFVEKSSQTNNINSSIIAPKIVGFKKKIYSFLDNLFPNVPVKLMNYFPIIYRDNLKINVWISNFGNLYKDQKNIVEHKISLNFFNSLGKNIWNKNFLVKKNENQIIEIPIYLLNKSEDEMLGSGWLKVEKTSLSPGFRGTTRPQIQILTKNSSCAVHGQNIKIKDGGFHSYVNNPKSERQFISFFNIGKKKVNIKLSYLNRDNKFEIFNSLNIDPLNSKIFEVKLANKGFLEFDPINIKWEGVGLYKAHIFITDKNLERISIDHL